MDIFKQAIAEAKAVREAAISNAREAMEESLTPHLKNMLAAKLQEMEEAENEDLMHEAEEEEEVEDTEDAEVEDSEDEEPAEDDAEESEDEAEEELDVDEMELEDLKNLIRDIVAQEMEAGDVGMGDLEDEEGGVEDMIDTDMDAEMEPEMDAEMGPEDEEEINLDELIAELESLEEGEEEIEEAKTKTTKKEKVQKMKGGTDEKMKTVTAGKKHLSETKQLLRKAYSTIETLRNDLSEVNLLNSKLLYVSKILKAHNLSESQKVNLIATFDKAETIKEVKLVFETVSENINQASKKVQKNRQPLREHKSFASKPAGKSTRGKIISEANEQVLRMQKLAGIIK